MNYYSDYETQKFKVKNAREFKKELSDQVVSEDIEVSVEKDGFQITGTGLVHLEHSENEELEHHNSFAYFLHKHIKENTGVGVIVHHRSQHHHELATTFLYITDLGISYKDSDKVFSDMEKSHYPRRVKCKTPCFNNETKNWIEAEKEYIAVEESRNKNRDYYVIKQGDDEAEITWGKEYFYE